MGIKEKQEQSGPERVPTPQIQNNSPPSADATTSSIASEIFNFMPADATTSTIASQIFNFMRNSTTSRKLDSQSEKTSDKTDENEKTDTTYSEERDEAYSERRTSISSIHIQNIMKKRRSHLKKWELWLGKS